MLRYTRGNAFIEDEHGRAVPCRPDSSDYQDIMRRVAAVEIPPPDPYDPASEVEASKESTVLDLIDTKTRLTTVNALIAAYPGKARLVAWKNRLQDRLAALAAELKD